jgi:hypothetical protein
MADDKKGSYDEYKSDLDKEFDGAKKYLKKLEDDRTDIFIKARRKVDYDVVGNRDKFGDDLSDELDNHIMGIYGIKKDSDYDKRSFKALVKKHLGVSRKEIKRIVSTGKSNDDIYLSLDQEIRQADSRFKQEHFYSISHDYIDADKPETLDHVIKYLEFDKVDNFDANVAKLNPEHIKRMFITKGIEGNIDPRAIPAELLVQHKPEKKKEKAA